MLASAEVFRYVDRGQHGEHDHPHGRHQGVKFAVGEKYEINRVVRHSTRAARAKAIY